MAKKKKNKISKGLVFKILGGCAVLLAVLLIFVLLTPYPKYKHGFNNLSDLKTFATTITEDTKMDGKNFLKPIYETYYQKKFSSSILTIIKSKFSWLFYNLGLKSAPLFSASLLNHLLVKVTKQRHEKGFKKLHVEKIALTEQSKIVVFGYVQGAFHSLVRYLNKLKELGVIDEQLKVTNSEYYLVFKGNVTNRSPYSMELLGLLLRLLERNPENVFYLRGYMEFFKIWKQHTLRREFELRASHLSSTKIPLQKEANAFFDSLPLVLYATAPFLSKDTVNYIKIKPYFKRKLQKLATESRYDKFLAQKNIAKIDQFVLDKKITSEGDADKISLNAILTAIKKRASYEKTDGLRFLPAIDGVPVWNVISCPSEPYRVAMKYYYDAFAIITPSKKIDDWKITLYHRDMRKKEDLTFKTRTHHFFDGRIEGKEKDGEEAIPEQAKKLVGQKKKVPVTASSVAKKPVQAAPRVQQPVQQQQVQQQPVQQMSQQAPIVMQPVQSVQQSVQHVQQPVQQQVVQQVPVQQPVQQQVIQQAPMQQSVQQQILQQPTVQVPVQQLVQQRVPRGTMPQKVKQPLQPAHTQQKVQPPVQHQTVVQQPVQVQQAAPVQQPVYVQQPVQHVQQQPVVVQQPIAQQPAMVQQPPVQYIQQQPMVAQQPVTVQQPVMQQQVAQPAQYQQQVVPVQPGTVVQVPVVRGREKKKPN